MNTVIFGRLSYQLIVVSMVLLFSSSVSAQTRTWTSRTGEYKVEASLVEYSNNQVKLRKSDGSELSVEVDKLSVADREFLKGTIAKPEPEVLPDNKSDDWKFLLRVASQGYTQGGKQIAPAIDADRLLGLVTSDAEQLAELASQLVLRQIVLDGLKNSQSIFGAKFKAAVEIGRGATANSALRQLGDEYFGDGVNYLDEMTAIMADIGPIVQSGINQQVASLGLHRQGCIMEGVVASQIARMQDTDGEQRIDADGLSIINSFYKSGETPYAAWQLKNTTETTFPWCIVILQNDCEYTTPESENFHNELSKGLGLLLVGGNQPDFSERTKALEAYSDVDKNTVFFIENWTPKQMVKIVGTEALEYFNTSHSVKISVYWPGAKQEFDVDIENHKKMLKAKFAPKNSRE